MANYQTIIDAIDAAVLANAAGPWEISTPTGGTVKYHDLDKLMTVRAKYVVLLGSETKGGGRRFGYRRFQHGSAVGTVNP